jgi:tRNA pseudouridine55 synthase
VTDINGVLLLDKPEGPTSHDIVALVRRVLGVRRVGHAGTLDPMATGLLVLMTGKATRLAPFLSGVNKTYRGVVRLGYATDTYDRAGEPLGPPRQVTVDHDTLMAALERFRGTIQQLPPAYSAKKIRGTPMYRLARRHKPIERVANEVTVQRLEFLGYSGNEVEIEAEVSAGTYLRSLAHDLGEMLGCGAHLQSLRRTASGPFRIDDALTPETLARLGREVAARIIPMEKVPLGLPTLALTQAGTHAVRHGRPCHPHDVVSPPLPLPPGRCRLQDPRGELIGIGEVLLPSPPNPRPMIRPQIVFPT